jgi:hypothetical protein
VLLEHLLKKIKNFNLTMYNCKNTIERNKNVTDFSTDTHKKKINKKKRNISKDVITHKLTRRMKKKRKV